VLYVAGSGGGFAEIGTAGGFMGHFMVVLGPPHRIAAGTHEANELAAIWPQDTQEIWGVLVVESTRGIAGLHEAELLVRIESKSSKLMLCGEISIDGELCLVEDDFFEIWQSPPELRNALRKDLIQQVVAEMKLCNGSWSMTTAARALFLSASTFTSVEKSELLSEIKACWGADPICTSVVIIFWQRYLCKIAGSFYEAVDRTCHPTDLILKFMPLKADRGLPGDVLRAMKECGWIAISRAPSPANHIDRSISCDSKRSQSANANLASFQADSVRSFATPKPCHQLRPNLGSSGFFECMEASLESIPSDCRAHGPHSSSDTPLLKCSDLHPRSKARMEEEGCSTTPAIGVRSPKARRWSITEEPCPSPPPRTQLAKSGQFSSAEPCTWGPIWL
jgi:hypothetical protein